MNPHHKVLVILTSIIIVGLIAIPIGNPRFIDRAIALEVAVIIGNSLTPRHVELMITFAKPLNSIVLIFGGYILQAALLYSSLGAIIISDRRRGPPPPKPLTFSH